MSNIDLIFPVIATALNGLLSGASLDQSIKQLPARHKIGAVAFSKYAKAADLGNGILFYAILGIGAAATTIITALIFHSDLFVLAAFFSVLHSLTTTQAAPLYLSQKKITDEKKLEQMFNKFEKWQTARTILLFATFLISLIALL